MAQWLLPRVGRFWLGRGHWGRCGALLTCSTALRSLTTPPPIYPPPSVCFHSITLPERFDLDALELVDYMYDDGHHLMSHDDITLADQIPTGGDVYVTITFDEDIMMDSTIHPEAVPSGGTPMEEAKRGFRLPLLALPRNEEKQLSNYFE
ncbi:hypothetical protein ACOSQ3_024343 [Xanthoceras sorbifolium]